MAGSPTAAAAARLRHDLGKYVRFSAPETLEADTGALRKRLRMDVLATRRSGSVQSSAVEVFEQWQREEGAQFPAGGALAERVASIARAIQDIRGLAARLDSLDRPGLERLDALTVAVARECRVLVLEAKS